MHCQGQTKNGQACTRSAQCNSRYCWQHQKGSSPKRSPKKSLQRSPKKWSKNDDIQKKYCDCLLSVEKKNPKLNKYAICFSSVGRISNSCKEYGH